MTLIKSISGIRGTIGGAVGDNLTPLDAVKFAAPYAKWQVKRNGNKKLTVVLGRDVLNVPSDKFSPLSCTYIVVFLQTS